MVLVQDVFYQTQSMTLVQIRDVITWAHENSLNTHVTMLNARKSWARVKSDKDFNEVFDLIDYRASVIFRIILRKEMNLYGIVTDEMVIGDIIEIGIRGIRVVPNEYFISIMVDKKHIGELVERYELEEIP